MEDDRKSTASCHRRSILFVICHLPYFYSCLKLKQVASQVNFVEIFGQTSKYVGGAEERDGGGVVGVHGRGL